MRAAGFRDRERVELRSGRILSVDEGSRASDRGPVRAFLVGEDAEFTQRCGVTIFLENRRARDERGSHAADDRRERRATVIDNHTSPRGRRLAGASEAAPCATPPHTLETLRWWCNLRP